MRRRTYRKNFWLSAIVLGVLLLALAGWALDAARWATGSARGSTGPSGRLKPALG
jgi:hypothetical protein